MLTEKEYVEAGGNLCPVCRSSDIEGQEIDIDGRDATQEVRCLACEASWTDVYTLKGIIDLENPNGYGD